MLSLLSLSSSVPNQATVSHYCFLWLLLMLLLFSFHCIVGRPQTQLERQIVATTNFFDECVPAQPGFSSSVAAVTIIPHAARVAKVWMKWYKIETKLRRLRYIKMIVQHKLEMETQGRTDIYHNITSAVETTKHGLLTATHSVGKQLSAAFSSTALSINRCGSADQSDEQQQKEEEEAGDTNAEKRQTSNTSDDPQQEQEPLVLNQESTTIEFGDMVDSDVKSPKNDNTIDVMNAPTTVDEKDATDTVQENNVFVTLWKKWRGGDAQGDETLQDIEMHAINVSTHSQSSVQAISKSTVTPSSLASNRREENEKEEEKQEEAPAISQNESEESRDFCYRDFDVKAYAKKLGFDEETELNGIVDGLGIEELSIFAREYAQSSANPCVYGKLCY
jgi:hypothetical protein